MITVVIPTYNPKPGILQRTLDALKGQTLPTREWELMLIDNASPVPLANDLIAWHPKGRIIREETLGLTHARLRAIKEAKGELMIWVDDDNILIPKYLESARDHFAMHPKLGAAGGPSIAEYLENPPPWYEPNLAPIGCRDFGNEMTIASWNHEYPECSPIGAGMVTRTEAIKKWAAAITGDSARLALGRTGEQLTSGEDNDINLVILREGWNVGYFPSLRLTHLIPGGRLTLEYQKKISRVAFRDFIRVLDIHGIRPWPRIPKWSLRPRIIKAWFSHKAWKGQNNAIRFYSTIGQYEGRASL